MDTKNVSNEVSWLDRDIWRWKNIGQFIPNNQIALYKSIRDHWCSGRLVIDVGCSAGYGTNILSHTARHVWGVDINEEAIAFAKHMYERPNMTFDIMDLENPPERPLAPFEVVVMSEVLEHLPSYELGLNTVKRFFNDKLDTVGFITVPNLGNPKVSAADSKNELHVNHWTPGEFYELMTKHFKHVTLYANDRIKNWSQDETTDGEEKGARIIVAKVEGIL